MKNNFKVAIILLFAMLCCPAAVFPKEKLANPPAGLTLIFKDFSVFETAFKSSKWDNAQSAFNKMDATFKKMLPQLQKDLSGNIAITYNDISLNLKESVKQKDTDATSVFYIELHKYIFTLISYYQYKTPPVITIINNYIAEAEEALEKKRYSRVASEMNEIIYLLFFVENYLANKDAKRQDIWAIKAKLNEIMIAAEDKKGEPVTAGIKSLKLMLSELMK